MRTLSAGTLAGCAMLAVTLAAGEWPQWRGPNRDGTAATFTAPSRWPETLDKRWTVRVGSGHSSPILSGARIYLHSREQENEIVRSIDPATGKTTWEDRYAAPYRMSQAAAAHGPGPKSTPAAADGRLFTLGISGILSAYDVKTGKVLWRKPAPAVLPLYGTAMSPIVEGGHVIAHVGGHDRGALTAFDVRTGAEAWKWSGDGPGYASPVVGTFGGTRQIVTQSQNRLVGVAASSGQLLWSVTLRTPYDQNSVTPLVYRDMVIYAGLEHPVVAARPVNKGGSWTLERVWENAAEGMYMSSPVAAEGMLFGLSNRNRGHYFALDLGTGKTLWGTRGREAENAAIVAADGLLFALEADAELVIARANRASFDVVRRYTVAESETWAHPLIDGNRIFVKDADSLTLWTVGS